MNGIIPIREYNDDEMLAINIVESMADNEDILHLKCMLIDIINRYDDSDVLGLIHDYEYCI